jgi:hypothetical protein
LPLFPSKRFWFKRGFAGKGITLINSTAFNQKFHPAGLVKQNSVFTKLPRNVDWTWMLNFPTSKFLFALIRMRGSGTSAVALSFTVSWYLCCNRRKIILSMGCTFVFLTISVVINWSYFRQTCWFAFSGPGTGDDWSGLSCTTRWWPGSYAGVLEPIASRLSWAPSTWPRSTVHPFDFIWWPVCKIFLSDTFWYFDNVLVWISPRPCYGVLLTLFSLVSQVMRGMHSVAAGWHSTGNLIWAPCSRIAPAADSSSQLFHPACPLSHANKFPFCIYEN